MLQFSISNAGQGTIVLLVGLRRITRLYVQLSQRHQSISPSLCPCVCSYHSVPLHQNRPSLPKTEVLTARRDARITNCGQTASINGMATIDNL